MNHRSLLKYGDNHLKDDGRLTAGELVSKYSMREFGSSAIFREDEVNNQWIDEEDD